LIPLAILWLLGVLGLGWLIKSIAILFILLLLTPVLAIVGLQWWLKRNLVRAECPVCQYDLMVLKGSEFQCPSCGEALKADQKGLNRLTPPGTIDVAAVEVPVQVIED
jgi:hypothetical protein